jgi:predicted  nucleic acid-binding Zn-ribbon protein
MTEDLVKLLDLQTKDLALLELDVRSEEIAAEEEALERDVAAAQARADQAAREAATAAGRRDELEQRIESYKKLNERRKQRLEFVRNPKEAATLMAELDLAQSVVKREEGEWVKSADVVTAAEEKAKAAAAAVDEVRAGQAEARAAVAAKRAALETERNAAVDARNASAEEVEKALRQRYERLFRSRKRAVVVAMVGVTCGACRTAVPTSRRAQIRSGAAVEACESCGVILYSEGSEG